MKPRRTYEIRRCYSRHCNWIKCSISVLSGLLLNNKIKNKNILTEVNLYNSGIFLLANVASNTLVSNKDAERYGNGHPNIVPYNLFKSKNGELAISVGNDNQFKVFSNLLKNRMGNR